MNEKKFYMSATKITLLLIVIAIIVLNFLQIEVGEPLKSTTTSIIAFYFGQKINNNIK